MKYAIIDSENNVINIIVYNADTAKEWSPPEGMRLVEIEDWVNIGDKTDKAAPLPPEEKPAQQIKDERNEAKKQDLALVAAFISAQVTRPQLTFSNFLDELELAASNL